MIYDLNEEQIDIQQEKKMLERSNEFDKTFLEIT